MPSPSPDASIGAGNPYPVTNYTCDGTRIAVRLMGDRASVSVDGAAAVDLPEPDLPRCQERIDEVDAERLEVVRVASGNR